VSLRGEPGNGRQSSVAGRLSLDSDPSIAMQHAGADQPEA